MIIAAMSTADGAEPGMPSASIGRSAAVPAAWVAKAQILRRRFQQTLRTVFETTDILLAPATPCIAPKLGQTTLTLGGETMNLRANVGLYTQPISFIGLPVVAVPVWLPDAAMPIGVQVIAPAWREDLALRVARHLEREGVCRSKLATL